MKRQYDMIVLRQLKTHSSNHIPYNFLFQQKKKKENKIKNVLALSDPNQRLSINRKELISRFQAAILNFDIITIIIAVAINNSSLLHSLILTTLLLSLLILLFCRVVLKSTNIATSLRETGRYKPKFNIFLSFVAIISKKSILFLYFRSLDNNRYSITKADLLCNSKKHSKVVIEANPLKSKINSFQKRLCSKQKNQIHYYHILLYIQLPKYL